MMGLDSTKQNLQTRRKNLTADPMTFNTRPESLGTWTSRNGRVVVDFRTLTAHTKL
jgi:hypothetical protein